MGRLYLTDALLRLIDPEDIPASFVALLDGEQAACGRYFLMTWALSRNTAYAWSITLSESLDAISATLTDINHDAICDGLRRAEAELGG